jgi:hypothetical protein
MKDYGKSSGRAGLPQEVKMKDYPSAESGIDTELNDTITGIDEVTRKSIGKRKSKLSNQK